MFVGHQGADAVTQLSTVTCAVVPGFDDVLGTCGGAGVKVETPASGDIANGMLAVVRRQYTVAGDLSQVQAAFASMKLDDIIPGDTEGMKVHLTLYSPTSNLFVSVELDAKLVHGGTATGSVRTFSDVQTMRLFHSRFPPSLGFELVVGGIVVIQVRDGLVAARDMGCELDAQCLTSCTP